MTQEVFLYRVYDTVLNQTAEVWSPTIPTVSPLNAEHPIDAAKTVIVDTVSSSHPVSDLDNFKMAVHASAKPYNPDGSTTYVVWVGAGDDMNATNAEMGIGEGELIQFNMTPTDTSKTVRVQFNPIHGKVWLHQGYIRFANGGIGDYMDAQILSLPTPVQQVAQLNLEIVDDWIIPSANGTHGFADPTKIQLIPRTFSKDGEWDYDGVNLIPNMTGTGAYKISNIERVIHKFINKVQLQGTCNTLSPLTSHDTMWFPPNYVMDIVAHNVSGTSWNANVLIEVYRERTYLP